MAFLGDFTPGIKLSFIPAAGSPCRVIPDDGRMITVVSSMHGQRVGKEFSLVDGAVKKGTEAKYSEYSAQSVYVADLAALQQLFATLKPSQCIILGCIPAAGMKPYRLNSKGWFEQHCKLPKGEGKLIGAVDTGDGLLRYGRFKENFIASRYALIDRDFNAAMPAALNADESVFFSQMETVWPGFLAAGKLIIGSSSNRVLRDGKPVNSSPSQHIYVELSGDDWQDWDQLRTRLAARAITAGLGFNAFSKSGANLKRSVFDISVLTVSHFVFEGSPLVHMPLTLAPADSRLVSGPAIPFPAALEINERAEYTRKSGNTINEAGRKLSVSNDAELTWETRLETEVGIMTLAEYYASGRGKLRCQTPFRDSQSWNGILNRTNDGRPFVHDNGAGVTYWLSGDAPVPESPDETPIALGEKSDLIADLGKLKSCPAAQLRATAKKILTRYVWKAPREFSVGDLCEQVINALPANCHPSLAGQLRRFAAWVERRARDRAVRSTALEIARLKAAGADYREVENLQTLLKAIQADPGAIHLIKAPHGTGKTELILKPLASLPGCAVAVTNRVSLVADLATRLQLSHYQHKLRMVSLNDLAICLPSLANPKFSDVLSRADTLLIDEIGAVLREVHSVGGTVKKTGPALCDRLGAMLTHARLAVGVDADLSSMDVETIRALTARRIVVWEMKATDTGCTVDFADADVVKSEILEAAAAGHKVRVACDSSKAVAELSALLKELHPDKSVMAIHSRPGDATNGDLAVQALLADINATVGAVDVLIHSPTLQSGVSLTVDHFTRTFGLFCGLTVTPAAFIQQLRRDRRCTRILIGFVGNCRGFASTDAGLILADLDATHRRVISLAQTDGRYTMVYEPTSPFDARVTAYRAVENADRNDAAGNLIYLLEARGFAVNRFGGSAKITPADKQQAKELAHTHYVNNVQSAQTITQERRAELETEYQPDPVASAEMEKFDAALACGVSGDDLTEFDLITFAHGKLIGQNRKLDALSSAVADVLAIDQADSDAAQQQALRRHSAAHVSAYHALFDECGIDRYTGAGVVTADSILEAFKRLADSIHAPVLSHAGVCRFDRLPKYPVRWLGDALQKFGLALEETGNADSGRGYAVRQDSRLTKDGLTMKAPGWLLMREILNRRHMADVDQTIYRRHVPVCEVPEGQPDPQPLTSWRADWYPESDDHGHWVTPATIPVIRMQRATA